MVRYLLRVGYIGTKYRGTQKLPDFPDTIQGVMEKALLFLDSFNTPITLFASRTDKGVHALMNALHVDLDHKIPGEIYQPHYIRKMLNHYLTENDHEIIVTNACVVPDEFHARFNAKWRSYYYRLAVLNPGISKLTTQHSLDHLPVVEINRCYTVPSELNTSIVKHVADMYLGQHDFSTFTKGLIREPWKDTLKVIEECQFYESPQPHFIDDPQYSNISIWEFYIKSKSFLYHQVRKLVGTAVSAGLGQISLSDVKWMLENPSPDNWVKSSLPPPGGLYLANIHYDKEDFRMNNEPKYPEKEEEEAVIHSRT